MAAAPAEAHPPTAQAAEPRRAFPSLLRSPGRGQLYRQHRAGPRHLLQGLYEGRRTTLPGDRASLRGRAGWGWEWELPERRQLRGEGKARVNVVVFKKYDFNVSLVHG